MKAMVYEFLMRRVYHSGRNKSNGADADIYRDMEHADNDLETKTMYDSQEAREYEFRKQMAKVREYVSNAIGEGSKQISYRASEEELKELEDMRATLNWNFYDKKKLDEIIDRTNSIFQKHNLEV
jgi:hypothetical protein